MSKATITGELFLSKVINDNDVTALNRHGITREHFQTLTEQKAYDFIVDYARSNEGNSPSYQALLDRVPEFAYQASTEDSFKWLGENIKKAKLNLAFTSFFNGDAFNKLWSDSIKENNPQGFADDVIVCPFYTVYRSCSVPDRCLAVKICSRFAQHFKVSYEL